MTKRIEYLDTMRGFTMILVVFSHVIEFSFSNTVSAYNDIFILFRMPLFFFVSGWLFFKTDRVWTYQTVRQITAKKFMIQIIPTIIFLTIFLYVQDAFEARSFGSTKKGYWFTITLFEFFVIYMASIMMFKTMKERTKNTIIISFALFLSCVSFYYERLCHNDGTAIYDFSNIEIFLSAIGFNKLKYYIFFILGTFAKKDFDEFIKLTNRRYFMAIFIILFFIISFFPILFSFLTTSFLAFILSGVSGILIIFTFFRTNSNYFCKNSKIGSFLQFIGRRTLDVYLLHYFFVYSHLERFCESLTSYNNETLEFFVTLTITFMVLCITLCVSSVIRLSPFLAHYLFGVKDNSTPQS